MSNICNIGWCLLLGACVTWTWVSPLHLPLPPRPLTSCKFSISFTSGQWFFYIRCEQQGCSWQQCEKHWDSTQSKRTGHFTTLVAGIWEVHKRAVTLQWEEFMRPEFTGNLGNLLSTKVRELSWLDGRNRACVTSPGHIADPALSSRLKKVTSWGFLRF